jgi:hypothetical protein
MMRIVKVLIFALLLIVPSSFSADTLPRELSDATFWRLVSEFSEEGGFFRFEYMSNEQQFQYVIPRLKEKRTPGGVYLGVGPEQNFTYIAALQPKMAFIVDIRRQNMIEHLMYKAIFEMSLDRVDFLSRLFSRKAPAGLSSKTPVRLLFQAFRGADPDSDLYRRNLQSIKDHLLKVHKFQLSGEDLNSIDYVYRAFFDAGNAFSYGGGSYAGFGGVSYAELMTATDQTGQTRSYLASEENFQAVREMHKKNLIIPVVGNFAGVKALRKVGQYIRDHGSTVTAFYTSNVEQYLFQQDNDWRKFLANVSAFPLDGSSTFIRSSHFAFGDSQPSQQFNRSRFIQLLSPMAEVTKAFRAGKITGYEDVIRMSK